MAEHSSIPVTRAPCDLDRFYQIVHQGCVMSRLPSDLYESMCFPTAFLTLVFYWLVTRYDGKRPR